MPPPPPAPTTPPNPRRAHWRTRVVALTYGGTGSHSPYGRICVKGVDGSCHFLVPLRCSRVGWVWVWVCQWSGPVV